MPKNIVVFSDGTGAEGGKGYNSNIYKLFNMIEDRTPRQISYYSPGLGTGWRRITGNIGGMGISDNIRKCYGFIFENYEAGDRIFLFGFSRGAATVRSLSNFMHYFGILPKARPELIKQAYGLYKKVGKQSDEEREPFVQRKFLSMHHTMWARVHFIGCFDTVAALGMPLPWASAFLDGLPMFRHKFHHFELSKSVTHAAHALAVDDERKTFHPVLWGTALQPYQALRQVWFSGMHTDVGGGYRDTGLSDISLVWMVQQAVAQGLLLYPRHPVTVGENADGHMENSRGTPITQMFRREVRAWDGSRSDQPVVHRSVLERRKNADNRDDPSYAPWIAALKPVEEPWVRYDLAALCRRGEQAFADWIAGKIPSGPQCDSSAATV